MGVGGGDIFTPSCVKICDFNTAPGKAAPLSAKHVLVTA